MVDLGSPVQGLQKHVYVPRPPATLYYHESMKPLARSIAERCSQTSEGPKFAEVRKNLQILMLVVVAPSLLLLFLFKQKASIHAIIYSFIQL